MCYGDLCPALRRNPNWWIYWHLKLAPIRRGYQEHLRPVWQSDSQAIRASFFDPSAGNFPTAFDLSNDPDSNPLSTPTFLSHSKDDNILPFKNGEMLCQRLRALSMTVTWKGYEDEGHWVNEPEGLNELNDFIKEASRSTEHQERYGT